MRDFQDYTKNSALRRRWFWTVPLVLAVAVVAFGAGMRVGVVSLPIETLGYDAKEGLKDSRGNAPQTGLLERLFGGSQVSDGPLNVLVLGVDKRPPGSNEAQVTTMRTDTIMLVQLEPGTGQVKLLSIPRDLLVEIEPGVKDRINAAYAYGGIEQTMSALQDYAEVPVDRYAVVDFEGFKDIIDAMGGVEVDVEEEVPPKYKIKDGLQTLSGRQALFYARYRGTAGGDLDRMERQRRLVAALRSEALRWDTVAEMPEITRTMNRNVETNLSVREALSLGRALVREGRQARMISTQLEGTPETLPNGNEVLVPDEEANEAILADFRY